MIVDIVTQHIKSVTKPSVPNVINMHPFFHLNRDLNPSAMTVPTKKIKFLLKPIVLTIWSIGQIGLELRIVLDY